MENCIPAPGVPNTGFASAQTTKSLLLIGGALMFFAIILWLIVHKKARSAILIFVALFGLSFAFIAPTPSAFAQACPPTTGGGQTPTNPVLEVVAEDNNSLTTVLPENFNTLSAHDQSVFVQNNSACPTFGYLVGNALGPVSCTVNIVANDTSDSSTNLDLASVDLDPLTPGVQHSLTQSSYTATYNSNTGELTVTVPDVVAYRTELGGISFGVSKIDIPYTINDALGNTSNSATASYYFWVYLVE